MVLTQGEVPWDPRSKENNSPIMDDFNKEVVAAAKADALAERQEDESTIFKVFKDPKEQQEMAKAIYFRLVQMTQQPQEWPRGAGQENVVCPTDKSQHIGGDRELSELIIKDMQLYEEVISNYCFKTEELNIDLVAAVNNFHKVQEEETKELFDKLSLHKVVPASVDYEKLLLYLLYKPKNLIKKTLENTTQLAKTVINTLPKRHLKSRFLMFWYPRLNEVVTTDTYFAGTKSIEGY